MVDGRLPMIRAKFEGELMIKAEDLSCLKLWLECQADIGKGEYVKVFKIDEIKTCRACGKDTTSDCSMCNQPLCSDISDCPVCPCQDR